MPRWFVDTDAWFLHRMKRAAAAIRGLQSVVDALVEGVAQSAAGCATTRRLTTSLSPAA